MTPSVPTHALLVARALSWLRQTKRCGFVLSNMTCNWLESPDAIGWNKQASCLIECKTTRADFARDRQKKARREGVGMGLYRFFLVPKGLVRRHEVNGFGELQAGEGWGLLYWNPVSNKVTVEKPSARFNVNERGEILFLASALTRVQLRLPEPLHEYIRWVPTDRRRGDGVLPDLPKIASDGSHEAPYVEDGW